ncbi:MAG: hypothetical protein RJA95_462 [Verrucomicrobiota bacterium]|jgi:hypothetical protein
MKQFLSLLLAAAVGSAATYFVMDARQSAAAATPAPEKVAAPKFASKTAAPSADAPAGETPRKAGSSRFGGKGGFLPEEIDGVTPEQMNKCRAALFKTFQDEGVKAARAKQAELRKEAEYASDDEKKALRTQFEDAQAEIRKATKAAMIAADAELTEDVVDKVLDAIEERLKQRAQQFQQNAKKK